ncbi:hypothetical protein GUITHDRAFT_120058 [Guillardia theta CCMP2712]|uniref:EF-hand domain-containing protein n=1 Tax=Guillardia theta (strain CCMP2712) TaxID=905079 RepID=L1IBW7_GUITC|nr:hypothetical protein GUITHDRAFT_120058 [Guillardia theta CCMP2712]EKX33728.1 hypothetical protein GUITHDRAFT_120058 [Guillardia theta CCMP2712]|eukprot:XP_005820708.1 hypothetical protein GUITHDRAFT_120058 [Guillardia theta CCMP2712]
MQTGPTFFFISFIVIAPYTLLPVVIAVLLQNFTRAAKQERLQEQPKEQQAIASMRSSLDPLHREFALSYNHEDLVSKVQRVFNRLDEEGSNLLNYNKIYEGLRKLEFSPRIKLSIEEFQRMTRAGKLLDEEGQMDRGQFERMMIGEFSCYCEAALVNKIRVLLSEDSSFGFLLVTQRMLLADQAAKERREEEEAVDEEEKEMVMLKKRQILSETTFSLRMVLRDLKALRRGAATLSKKLADMEGQALFPKTPGDGRGGGRGRTRTRRLASGGGRGEGFANT